MTFFSASISSWLLVNRELKVFLDKLLPACTACPLAKQCWPKASCFTTGSYDHVGEPIMKEYFLIFMGERRGSNPRVMESQSIALPLGYARHENEIWEYFYTLYQIQRKFSNLWIYKFELSLFAFFISNTKSYVSVYCAFWIKKHMFQTVYRTFWRTKYTFCTHLLHISDKFFTNTP